MIKPIWAVSHPFRISGYTIAYLGAKLGQIGIPIILVGFAAVLITEWIAVGVDDAVEKFLK